MCVAFLFDFCNSCWDLEVDNIYLIFSVIADKSMAEDKTDGPLAFVPFHSRYSIEELSKSISFFFSIKKRTRVHDGFVLLHCLSPLLCLVQISVVSLKQSGGLNPGVPL